MRTAAWFTIGLSLALAGCGGGSSPGDAVGGTFEELFSREAATARIEVDPATNTAKVTNLTDGGRAVFGGNTVHISSAEVLAVPGNTVSSRILRLTVQNRGRVAIGVTNGVQFNISTALGEFSAMTEAGIGTNGLTDGAAASASTGQVRAVWEDVDGTIYFTQGNGNAVRRIKNGSVSTLGQGYQNIWGITGDPNSDFIYFVERDRHRVIRLKKDGTSGAVIAGGPSSGDVDGPGGAARFNTLTGLAFGDGVLYVADLGNNKVKAISSPNTSPTVTTLANIGVQPYGITYGNLNGRPVLGVTSSSAGQVWVVDPSGGRAERIRSVPVGVSGIAVHENRILVSNATTHTVTSLRIGSGANPFALASWAQEFISSGTVGYADGTAMQFSGPQLAASGQGQSFLLADTNNHRIRRVNSPNFAGGNSSQPVAVTNFDFITPSGKYAFVESAMQPTSTRTIDVAFTVQFEATMTFYVTVSGSVDGLIAPDATTNNGVAPNVFLRWVGGVSLPTGNHDGGSNTSTYSGQAGIGRSIAVDAENYIYLPSARQISVMAPDGSISTIANPSDLSGASAGNGFDVRFEEIQGIDINRGGTLMLVTSANRVYLGSRVGFGKTSPSSWDFSIIGGDAASGLTNGNGTVARFSSPAGITWDIEGKQFLIVDTANNVIRKAKLTGVSPVLAGSWEYTTFTGTGAAGFADGGRFTAQFDEPRYIAVGPDGHAFVGDRLNRRLRRIDRDGLVTTVAGDGTAATVDGNPGSIQSIRGLDVDNAGNVYFYDQFRLRVWRNNQLNTILVDGGSVTTDGFANGSNSPGTRYSVAVNPVTGQLFILGRVGDNNAILAVEGYVP